MFAPRKSLAQAKKTKVQNALKGARSARCGKLSDTRVRFFNVQPKISRQKKTIFRHAELFCVPADRLVWRETFGCAIKNPSRENHLHKKIENFFWSLTGMKSSWYSLEKCCAIIFHRTFNPFEPAIITKKCKIWYTRRKVWITIHFCK